MPFIELALVGLGVGALVGMTGMGGGAILTPVLVLVFGINPAVAVGSDLAVSLAIKPVGAAVHRRAGTVRWDVVGWLLPGAVPAALAGAWLVSAVGSAAVDGLVRGAIGTVLVVGVVTIGVQRWLAARRVGVRTTEPSTRMAPRRRAATLVIGLIGGLIVGFTSVGSGSLIIVLLLVVHPDLRPDELVGTDLAQAVPLVAAALVGHLLFGEVDLGLSGPLVLGALPGVYFGARASLRLPGDVVKAVLSVLLLGSALSLWGVEGPVVLGGCTLFTAWLLAAGARRRRRVRAGAHRPVVSQPV